MVLLIRRLTPARQHHIACHVLAGLASIWAVASLFTVAIRCNTSAPWLSWNTEQCPDLVCIVLKSKHPRLTRPQVQPLVGDRDHQLDHRGFVLCPDNVYHAQSAYALQDQIQSHVGIHDAFTVGLPIILAVFSAMHSFILTNLPADYLSRSSFG